MKVLFDDSHAPAGVLARSSSGVRWTDVFASPVLPCRELCHLSLSLPPFHNCRWSDLQGLQEERMVPAEPQFNSLCVLNSDENLQELPGECRRNAEESTHPTGNNSIPDLSMDN